MTNRNTDRYTDAVQMVVRIVSVKDLGNGYTRYEDTNGNIYETKYVHGLEIAKQYTVRITYDRQDSVLRLTKGIPVG